MKVEETKIWPLTLLPLLGVPSPASSSAILLVMGAALASDAAELLLVGELCKLASFPVLLAFENVEPLGYSHLDNENY